MYYVTNMLAKPKKVRTSQMNSVQNIDKALEIYIKNAFVCLYSVKQYNSNVNCIFFVDFDLGDEWSNLFKKYGITVSYVKFGDFSIGDQFNWGIVQYRYDVINKLCEIMNDDDQVIMLDTDVVCVGSLDNIFKEIEHRLCLFDVQHSLDARDRRSILNNYLKIYPNESHCELIHYGGEFIGARKSDLVKVLDESAKVIGLGNSTMGLVNFNDEHITSIAVDNLKKQGLIVNNANAYIYRYWTSYNFRCPNFYLAATNYHYNPVVLWHLPVEKKFGIMKVYQYIIKRKKMPSTKKMAAWFGFPKITRTHMVSYFFVRVFDYLKNNFSKNT